MKFTLKSLLQRALLILQAAPLIIELIQELDQILDPDQEQPLELHPELGPGRRQALSLTREQLLEREQRLAQEPLLEPEPEDPQPQVRSRRFHLLRQ